MDEAPCSAMGACSSSPTLTHPCSPPSHESSTYYILEYHLYTICPTMTDCCLLLADVSAESLTKTTRSTASPTHATLLAGGTTARPRAEVLGRWTCSPPTVRAVHVRSCNTSERQILDDRRLVSSQPCFKSTHLAFCFAPPPILPCRRIHQRYFIYRRSNTSSTVRSRS